MTEKTLRKKLSVRVSDTAKKKAAEAKAKSKSTEVKKDADK